jgi:DNA modification methylase
MKTIGLRPTKKRVPSVQQSTLSEFTPEVQQALRNVHSFGRNSDISTFAKKIGELVGDGPIEVPPFASDIKATKTSDIYNAHSYPTKVPYEGIVPYLLHYSRPNEIVLDSFCGSGMTGVAALSSGRCAILIDLSPAATHIAYNYCTPVDIPAFRREFDRIMSATKEEFQWLYGTTCERCKSDSASIDYLIWSDTFRCPSCRRTIVFWDSAYDHQQRVVKPTIQCVCGKSFRKSELTLVTQVPVETHYYCPSCGHGHHPATNEEKSKMAKIRHRKIPYWYPKTRIDPKSEMYRRSALHLRHVSTIADLYTKRNIWALSKLWNEIQKVKDDHLKRRLEFVFTASVNRASKRYVWSPKRPLNVHVGNLYIPSINCEFHVGKLFTRKFNAIAKASEIENKFSPDKIRIATMSAANLQDIPSETIHYIFSDPPFGGNIFYADLNLTWEAWLGKRTDGQEEAVINKARKENAKTFADYERIMSKSFQEMYRVLRPGRWATIIFHNSNNRVWKSIQRATYEAGFEIKGASIFDKGQYSSKQLKGISGKEKVISVDIIFNLRKPLTLGERATIEEVDNVEGKVRSIVEELTISVEDTRLKSSTFAYTRVIQTFLNRNLSIEGVTIDMVAKCLDELST